jgi:hypothetical protein
VTAVPIDDAPRSQRRPEPAHRRTHQKVRRESRYAGGEQWPLVTWSEANRMTRALDLYREKLRRPGERTGAAPSKGDKGGISRGAADLYRLLCNIAVRGRGRLEPSAAWLAKALNTSAKMVHDWKAQLKRHGFLDWRRRYVDRGLRGLRGPQVEQISNAYILRAPAAALQALASILKGRASPPPIADASAREERLQAAAAQRRAELKDTLDGWGVHVALDPSNWAPEDDGGT